jgi:hypothetical protein
MSRLLWGGARTKGPNIAATFLVLLLVELFVAVGGQSTTTSASLNNPSQATSTLTTGTVASSTTSAASSSTSIVPISLSGQQVPYLLSTPQSNDVTHMERGPFFSGCSDSSSVGYVAAENRINISAIYTQFDKYDLDSALGGGYPYTSGTLRIVGIGAIGNESYAFNSYTDSTGVTRGLLSESDSGFS